MVLALCCATSLITDNIANKAEVAKELIVDDVILTTVKPEHISPIDVDLPHNTLGSCIIYQTQGVLKFCLEMLELSKRLTT